MMTELERFYFAIKELTGISGPTAVSKYLGYTPQAINHWNSRQHIPADALLSLYEKLGVDPLWIRSGKGEMLPSSVPLTGAQKHWLSLMEGLIDDDIEEFAVLIEARRQKNLKISAQLTGKNFNTLPSPPSQQPAPPLSGDKADKLREIFAGSNEEQKRLVEMAIQLMQTDQETLKRHSG